MKTEANPSGIYRDDELYEMFTDIAKYVLPMLKAVSVTNITFSYLLSNYEIGDEFALRERATKYAQLIISDIESHLARHSYGMVCFLTSTIYSLH